MISFASSFIQTSDVFSLDRRTNEQPWKRFCSSSHCTFQQWLMFKERLKNHLVHELYLLLRDSNSLHRLRSNGARALLPTFSLVKQITPEENYSIPLWYRKKNLFIEQIFEIKTINQYFKQDARVDSLLFGKKAYTISLWYQNDNESESIIECNHSIFWIISVPNKCIGHLWSIMHHKWIILSGLNFDYDVHFVQKRSC